MFSVQYSAGSQGLGCQPSCPKTGLLKSVDFLSEQSFSTSSFLSVNFLSKTQLSLVNQNTSLSWCIPYQEHCCVGILTCLSKFCKYSSLHVVCESSQRYCREKTSVKELCLPESRMCLSRQCFPQMGVSNQSGQSADRSASSQVRSSQKARSTDTTPYRVHYIRHSAPNSALKTFLSGTLKHSQLFQILFANFV